MNSSASTRLLLIAAIVFLASCTASEKTATQTSTSPDNFDASSYISPENYGYDLAKPHGSVPSSANTSFTPVSFDPYRAQKRIDYPKFARKKNIQGKVILRVYVDSTGSLTNIEVIESPHSMLTRATKKAVTEINFDPATLNGKPVNSYIQFPGLFRLRTF